jgi:hypothetical protein
MTTRRWLMLCSLVLAMPTSAAVFRVWVHQDVVRMGYQLSAEEKERAHLQDLVRQLEIERAAERSPEHLLQWAAKLNLVPPTSRQIIKEGSPNVKAKRGAHGQR